MRLPHTLIAAVLLIVAGRVGRAEPPRDDPAPPRIAQLEERLRMQQERLAALEARLEEGRRQDLAAARAEALRAQVRELLAEQEFREAMCPPSTTAGYGRAAPPAVRQALRWALATLADDPAVTRDAQRLAALRRCDPKELTVCYRS